MILVIFTVYLLLHSLLFKAPKGALYCGLFGGSFNQPIAGQIIWKLKVLGFFNQSRGEHSCGVYNGDQLVKGVAENKKFMDFAINVGIQPGNGQNNVFIGHTRYATIGDHTAENAHPFNIQDKMIFAHNGKIEDMWKGDRLETVWSALRTSGTDPINVKVDSQALGHMVVNLGFKVLEKYKGYAALLMHKLDEPDTLYVYHGASKTYRAGELMEERPMFFMQTPEGVYFSSMEESLKFIRNPETDDAPLRLVHNRVVKLRAGAFMGKSLIISRDEANCSPVYWANNNYNHTTYANGGQQSPKPATTTTERSTTTETTRTTFTTSTVGIKSLDITKETVPSQCFSSRKNAIFYWRNRYHLPDNKVCHGVVVVDKHTGNVLSPVSVDEGISKTLTLYFWHGVYLKDKKAYDLIERSVADPKNALGRHLSNPVFNFARYISKLAKYPVINLGDEASEVPDGRDVFYYNGSPVGSEAFTPLFSNRNYRYREGKLVVVRHDVNRGDGGYPQETFFLGGADKATGFSPAFGGTNQNRSGKGSSAVRVKPGADACSETTPLGGSCGSSNPAGNNDAGTGGLVSRHPDVAMIRRSFEMVFESVEDAETEFSGYNYVALKLFVIDVLEKLLHQYDADPSVVESLVHDLYEQAVQQGVTLEEILDKGVEDIDYYIVEVLRDENNLMNLNDDEEDVIDDVEEEDDEDVERDEPLIDQALAEDRKKKEDGAPAQGSLFPPARIVNFTNPTTYKQEDHEDMNAFNQQQLRMEQDEDAVEIIDNIVTLLEGARKVTARLNPLEESLFASNAANRILTTLDELKSDLQALAQAHGHGELALKIKQTMSAHADLGSSTL